MSTTFKCKYCGEENEISEALTNQIQEEVLTAEREKHLSELEEVKRQTEAKAASKFKADYELKMKELEENADAERKRKNEIANEATELNKKLRELQRKDDERELQMQKTLAEKEEKIRDEAKKLSDEENNLVIKEKEKKLQDALKQVEEMRRKIQQGSQQTQGEILELELENILRATFKSDQISEVKKGQKGADLTHIVCSNSGTVCGKMLWESKNYQEKWSNTWIPKLKQDQRAEGAVIGILVSHTLPSEVKTDICFMDGVWVCKPSLVIPLGTALRDRIYEVARQKAVGEHRGKKADVLYDYISGNEFRQQIEALVEIYQEMRNQIDSERRTFEAQWRSRERQLERYIRSTAAICGDIQGIAGQSSIPAFKGLETPTLESGT
jgi:hypothetical protein